MPAMTDCLRRGADAESLRFPGGTVMHLLAEEVGATTRFSAHRSVFSAGAEGARPHHHEHTTHLLFVVAGALDLLVGEHVVRVESGDVAVIPPGVTHAFRAAPDSEADLFDVVTPGRSFDMFRQYAVAAGNRSIGPSAAPAEFDTYADDRPDWAVTQTIGDRS